MGVLALPEKINEYLALVCRQIRWKRALPDLRRELGTHLLEQRDACIEAGMTEDEAEAEAVRQMGDGLRREGSVFKLRRGSAPLPSAKACPARSRPTRSDGTAARPAANEVRAGIRRFSARCCRTAPAPDRRR